MLAYSARNRSASIRIPYVSSPKARRIEARFPDPAANPYLCFAALLMAGLDGIQNKIHPGDAADKNLYDLPPEEAKEIPQVCVVHFYVCVNWAIWILHTRMCSRSTPVQLHFS